MIGTAWGRIFFKCASILDDNNRFSVHWDIFHAVINDRSPINNSCLSLYWNNWHCTWCHPNMAAGQQSHMTIRFLHYVNMCNWHQIVIFHVQQLKWNLNFCTGNIRVQDFNRKQMQVCHLSMMSQQFTDKVSSCSYELNLFRELLVKRWNLTVYVKLWFYCKKFKLCAEMN